MKYTHLLGDNGETLPISKVLNQSTFAKKYGFSIATINNHISSLETFRLPMVNFILVVDSEQNRDLIRSLRKPTKDRIFKHKGKQWKGYERERAIDEKTD